MDTEASTTKPQGLSVLIDLKLILASISLGCLLLVSEAERLPVLSFTSTASDSVNPFSTIVILIVLSILLIVAYKKPSASHIPASVIIGLSLIMSLVLVGFFSPVSLYNSELTDFFDAARTILWPLLLYFWVREATPIGYKFTIQSFAFGLITLGILNLLSIAMNTEVAIVVVAILPLVAAILLLKMRSIEQPVNTRAQNASTTAQTKLEKQQFVSFNLIPLACFAIVFGNIHLSWVNLQDGGVVSLIVQLGTASGTLLAGFGVYGLFRTGALRKYNSIEMLLLVALTLFSIWLSTYTNQTYVFFYLTLLNMAQKGTFLLIFLAPFQRAWPNPIFAWCAAMYSFICGTLISSFLMFLNIETFYVGFAIVALCILLGASVVLLIHDIEGQSRNHEEGEKPASATTNDSEVLSRTLHQETSSVYELQLEPHVPNAKTSTANNSVKLPEAASHSETGETAHTAKIFDPAQAVKTPIPISQYREQPLVVTLVADSSEDNEASQETSDEKVEVSTPTSSRDREYAACMRLTHEFALTRREADVLTLLVHGRTAEPIAKTLGISPATAKTHVRNIYAKLGVHTQQEVIDLMESYVSDK